MFNTHLPQLLLLILSPFVFLFFLPHLSFECPIKVSALNIINILLNTFLILWIQNMIRKFLNRPNYNKVYEEHRENDKHNTKYHCRGNHVATKLGDIVFNVKTCGILNDVL